MSQPTAADKIVLEKSSNTSGLEVELHPLVLINISDHFTRQKVENNYSNTRVIGVILGLQNGRNVEICNSFELVNTEVEKVLVLDTAYLKKKYEQFKKVFPNYDLLGWYSTGSEVSKDDILLHKQILEFNESPLYLMLDTVASKNKDLPVYIYESELHMVGDEPTTIFVKTPFKIQTGEAERIGVNHIAKVTPSGSEGSGLTTHLLSMHNAISMLNIRVKALSDYLQAVKEKRLPYEHGILRKVKSLCNQLPTIDTHDFKRSYLQEYNDVLLVTYLASITKTSASLNDTIDKYLVSHEKQVHLEGPIKKSTYLQLNEILKTKHNGEIIHYIPDNSYLVSIVEGNNHNSINEIKKSIPSVQWTKPLEPRLKQSPLFKLITSKSDIIQLKVYYHVSKNEDYNQISNKLQQELNSAVKISSSSSNVLVSDILKSTDNNSIIILLNLNNINNDHIVENIIYKLSTQSLVYWIEPISKQTKNHPSNINSHYSIQNGKASVQSTPLWDLGLKGDGEIIGCADTGIDVDHCFFYDTNPIGPNHRKVISYTQIDGAGDTGDSQNGHGTHIVGTILGSLPDGSAQAIAGYVGGSPNSKVSFIDLQASANADSGLSIPSNITKIYEQTYGTNAKIHCDAWNSNIGPFYTSVTSAIDQFQYEHLDFLVIRSSGNSNNFGYSSVYSLSQESTSKNSLVVGSYNQPSSIFTASLDYWDFDSIYNSVYNKVCNLGQSVYDLSCSDLQANPADIQTECCGGSVALQQLCCKTYLATQYSTNTSIYEEFYPSVFSGIGPTSDGRLKPDLLAPGSPVISSRAFNPSTPDHCDPISGTNPSLLAMEGSSQAAAVMTAAASLVRQYYREGYFVNGVKDDEKGFAPSAALVKATLINTADFISTSIDNIYAQGFGSVSLSKLFNQTSSSTVKTFLNIPSSINGTDPIINTNDTFSYCLTLSEPSDIDITLVWTDPPASPLSAKTLVNNLDLVLLQFINGGNVTQLNGNGFADLEFDDSNNVEIIRIKQAPAGRYDIIVVGANIVVPDQTFALVIRTTGEKGMEESYCSECFYDPDNNPEQFCLIENGVGTQVCGEDNLLTKCKIYACDTGYVYDNGITKKCITTLALTLYNIVLLAVFGIIIVTVVIFILLCYKSKSLDQEKYRMMKKDDDFNGGKSLGGKSSSANSGDSNKDGNTKNGSIELGQVDEDGNGQGNNHTPGGYEDSYEPPVYDEDGRLISGQEIEISILEVISLGKPESHILGAALILSFVDIALGLAIPLVAANIFDILYSDSGEKISTTILTFALIIIGMIVVQFLYGILLALAGHKIIARLRNEMFKSLMKQDMAFFNERKTGELMSRLASDVSSVRSIISDSIPNMITQIATIGGTLIMLFIISWKLSLVVLCPLPILLVFSKFYGGYIEVISVKVQDALADAATHAAETLFNMKTVRWFSSEEKEVAKFSVLINISYKIALKMTIWNGIYSSTSGIFEQLSVFILLWYGSSLVRNGDLTPSMLIAFNLFLPFITSAVTHVATLYTTYKSYKGSSYRFFEIMQRVPEIQQEGGIQRNSVQGIVEFKNVGFTYSSNPSQPILDNVDIQFNPGSITALIGPSGGGKSTMLSLIGRLYNISGGAITLDGTDIKEFNVANLHQHISIVNQEPSLFSGTIAENIMYGKANATRDEVITACKQANAHDFIMAMPEKYDTLIGERGTSLSGGQKQRIAIARTIIKNPTVLLLDEATSELDVESERLVQEAIDRLVVGRTVIIVAHRLTTILTADIIAVVTEGGITEKGTPEELLAKKGMFYDFVQIQYGKQGEDIEIQLPTRDKSNRTTEKLRQRSETIKQIAKGKRDSVMPYPKGKNIQDYEDDYEDDRPSGSSQHRPPSTPMWRRGKKGDGKQNQSLLLVRNSTQHRGGGWQKGNVDDKLQRVLQKSRKKGFYNNQENKDIKAALVLY
ncbi:hypothetical protein DICPUDRAFT_150096 [Dictyostelium purpureum]|uniref:COP9 signalosome complex subunit 6 n=1 Tax=Dictyostelium purpureum TaxID=5786 RepID=F0ZFF8_DICPU|nr:uncharacterized protein DICPUDRAFT_150096 [Dictyostelium purpureum]EGC37344.1 hypothetical protein DICPUDRAFT_150096 [Dictyostelium purpureum]|eukprot:XP_003286158.1 hypothetical protein DICPUDRAFT_150096 [Dictyostelium purpureum]